MSRSIVSSKKRKVEYIDLTQDAHRESSLCKHCSSISAVVLRNALEQAASSQRVMDLPWLDAHAISTCPGCQLFLSIRLPEKRKDVSKPHSLYVHRIPNANVWGRAGNVLVLASEDSKDKLGWHVDAGGAIACTASVGPQSFVQARHCRADRVDYGLIRSWMDSCLEFHTKCARYRMKAPRPKRMALIDCEARRIVPADSHQYVALSYVWGLSTVKSECVDDRKDRELPHNLPLTIEDAITVTKELGYRHIWIDKYCIDQDNDAEKMEQIQQMNIIYRCAEVTIIAAAGSDPHFGLPGVSQRYRRVQPSVKFGDAQFVSILPQPDFAICSSTWFTRGWTYQEGYFSVRRLTFLEDQMYYHCYSAAAIESVCHNDGLGVSYASKDKDNGDQEAFEILDYLAQYSGKQLTYGADAINAVAGVFNDDGFIHGTTTHHLGIPIVVFSLFNLFRSWGQRRRATDAFLIGLCWQNRIPGERRGLWPSWAWAEWIVEFDYNTRPGGRTGDAYTLSTDFVTRPIVLIEMKNGDRLDMQANHALHTIRTKPATLSRYIHIESWIMKLDIRLLKPGESVSSSNIRTSTPRQSAQDLGKQITEYYAGLKDHPTIKMRIPIWPMYSSSCDKSYPDGTPKNFAPGIVVGEDGSAHEFLGVILARGVLSGDRWRLVLMIVVNKGSHYERIGHCSIMSDQLLYLARETGSFDEKWVFGWQKYHRTTQKVCGKFMQRDLLRIG